MATPHCSALKGQVVPLGVEGPADIFLILLYKWPFRLLTCKLAQIKVEGRGKKEKTWKEGRKREMGRRDLMSC